MGSSRGGLLGISGSPARSSPRHTGNGSHAVHRCVQLGLGSLTRLTLDSGSAFLRSPHINILEMQAVISAVREFLPHLRSIVVRLMCDNAVTGCLHQEWRGHAILHSHAGDDTPAEVVQSQGNQAGASPSGWCSVQDRSDSQHWVDVGYGTSTTSVLQVGRTTDRHVCYILQQTTDQVCIAISAPQGRVDGTWCPLPGTTGGASCTHSRHWSWSLRCYRRSNSLMECKWFLWLHCKKQLTGIRSFWNYRKKIRSHCTSKVNHC